MLIYQALKSLAGSAEMRAAIDRHFWDGSRYRNDQNDNGDGLASKAYLSEDLHDPPVLDFQDGEFEVDLEELGYYEEKVIWLNGEPQSFKEFGATYLAVSLRLSHFGRKPMAKLSSVWKRAQRRSLLLGRCYHLQYSTVRQTQGGRRRMCGVIEA